jgi:hypothetical protein
VIAALLSTAGIVTEHAYFLLFGLVRLVLAELPLEEDLTVLFGILNNGARALNVSSIVGSVNSPLDFKFYAQNVSRARSTNQARTDQLVCTAAVYSEVRGKRHDTARNGAYVRLYF